MMAMIRICHQHAGRGQLWTVEEIQPDGDGGTVADFNTRSQAVAFALAWADRTGATLQSADVIAFPAKAVA